MSFLSKFTGKSDDQSKKPEENKGGTESPQSGIIKASNSSGAVSPAGKSVAGVPSLAEIMAQNKSSGATGGDKPLPSLLTGTGKFGGKKKVNVKICFDTTGSMGGSIRAAKEGINLIMPTIAKTEPDLEAAMQLLAYQDYHDNKGELQVSPVTGDAETLKSWLATQDADGSCPVGYACIEYALQHILNDKEHATDVVVIIGDMPGHTEDMLAHEAPGLKIRTAEAISLQFGKEGIPIHTFQIDHDIDCTNQFKAIAKNSKGQHAEYITNPEEFAMMVSALIIACAKGAAGLAKFSQANAGKLSQLTAGKFVNDLKLLGDGAKK